MHISIYDAYKTTIKQEAREPSYILDDHTGQISEQYSSKPLINDRHVNVTLLTFKFWLLLAM